VTDGVRAGRFRQYLLGRLPEKECDALEQSYFETEEGLAELQDAEEELLDAYEGGTLSAEDRARFEARYLGSEEGSRRLVMDRTLKRIAGLRAPAEPASARPDRATWLAWAAGIAIAALAGPLLVSQLRLERELRQANARNEALRQQAQEQAARIDEQAGRLETLRGEMERMRDRAEQIESLAVDPGRAGRLVSILLRPGLKRDLVPVPELVLPPDAVLVRMALALDDVPSGPYRASLQTVEGREVWSRSHLRANVERAARTVRLTVPTDSLQPGHHVVELTADGQPSSPLAEYVFRVRRP
jgi:hypothetical protein